MLRGRLVLALLMTLLPATGRTEDLTVTAVTAPLTLQTAAGDILVLPGLLAPDLPAARAALEDLTLNRRFTLTRLGRDRWNREQAALAGPDGLDPALQLLRDGWAQIMPEQREPDAATRQAEAAARTAGRGLWALDCCRILDAGTASRGLNSWRIIRGTVTGVTRRRQDVFINFGPDWRTDFTVRVSPTLARALPLDALTGHTVEVRGWLEWSYGPAIRINRAAQLLLPDDAG